MHMQPIFRMNPLLPEMEMDGQKQMPILQVVQVGKDGMPLDVGMDIFQRGLCLPSDNKMTVEQQNKVIEVVKGCFE